MSIEAMAWVLNEAPTENPATMLLLVALAQGADGEGRGSRASVAALAGCARMSERAVHRRLRELQEAGIIERGAQQQVAHRRGDRRPTVWDIVMPQPSVGAS